jgi:hypothetical protein
MQGVAVYSPTMGVHGSLRKAQGKLGSPRMNICSYWYLIAGLIIKEIAMLSTQKKNIYFRLIYAVTFVIACTGLCFGQSKWTRQNSGTISNLTSIYSGKGIFAAVGGFGKCFILTSPNGIAWNVKDSVTVETLNSITYGNGTFVAVGGRAGIILTSNDASTWTHATNFGMYSNLSVTYGDGLFVFLVNAREGTYIGSSHDALVWTYKIVGNWLSHIAYCNNRFISLGYGGTILSSPDGTIWRSSYSDTSKGFYSVTYGNGRYVTVGGAGTILSSSDDSVWTLQNSITAENLWSVTYGLGEFVAVGNNGIILSSPDAITWTIKNSGTTNALRSVTYSDSLFVVVGDSGIILTSKLDNTGTIQSNLHAITISKAKKTITRNYIVITLPDATTISQLSVGIFTVAGKRIYSSTAYAHNGIISIPAPKLPASIYYLSINDGGRRIASSAFIP